MADIIEVFFILQFFVVVGIIIAKLINVMTAGKFYQKEFDKSGKEKCNITLPFVLFFLYNIFYAIGFISFMNNPTIFTSMLFQLETFFISLNMLFLIIELFLFYKIEVSSYTRDKRNSMQEYKRY